jgi:hypothetical protein
MHHDPIHRRFHHNELTFSLIYAFTENFALPLSHDEVVHGKGSMLAKMPGSGAEKFANLRAFYGFMWGPPGKKLLFMGQEFAQGAEWNHAQSLDWHVLDIAGHAGMQRLVRDLGEHRAMILCNHGLLTAGETIAQAFDLMYYLERACTAQVDALAGGSKLRIPPPEVAAKVALQFAGLPYKKRQTEWRALRRALDRTDPSYRD